jgi:putative ABC transport system substrate-binding protein
MRGLGWIAGQNLTIVWRSAEGQPDRYTALANELVKLKLDVIVVSDGPGPALQKATGTIPIVSVGIGSDIQDVQNLAHPGGNATGLTTTSDMPLAEKRLELLKEAVPKVSRVAYLSDHGTTRAPGAAARALRVSQVPIPVNDPHALRPALAFLERQQVDAVFVASDRFFLSPRTQIIEFAARRRLPDMYNFDTFVRDGGLMSYRVNFADLFRRAATYVDKILKGKNRAIYRSSGRRRTSFSSISGPPKR